MFLKYSVNYVEIIFFVLYNLVTGNLKNIVRGGNHDSSILQPERIR